MFKLKIKIILRSGAEILIRAKKFDFSLTAEGLIVTCIKKSNSKHVVYKPSEAIACIVKNWWQPW